MKPTDTRGFASIAILGGVFVAGNWFGLFGRDFAYPTLVGSLLVALGFYGFAHGDRRPNLGPLEALPVGAPDGQLILPRAV